MRGKEDSKGERMHSAPIRTYVTNHYTARRNAMEFATWGLLLSALFLLGHALVELKEANATMQTDVASILAKVEKLDKFNKKYLQPAFTPVE